LIGQLSTLDLPGRLILVRKTIPGRIVLTTSFGIEDQLLTHWIAETGLDIALATLDTGRLFPETLDVWAATEARYGLTVEAYAPDAAAVGQLLRTQGAFGFKESVSARKNCCGVRKIEPLGRALSGASGWITGVRADQSENRSRTGFAEVDVLHDLLKINPLLDLTRNDIVAETTRLDIPVNALHERGFLSIGCAPCTRALHPGEAERAGRWWWEDESAKECGLHQGRDGKLVRSSTPEARP
jgi:phosphoadenosine phosphosulfate reductase